jgi:N-acetyl-anhydromuramyl-L-alanine amidase AmpD
MEAGYADLPYHFVITANGTVHEGRKIEVVGAHAGEIKGNKDITKDPDYGSIGIVLTGDFESRMKNVWTPDKPTSAQLASLQHLLNHLTQKYKINPKNIIKHSEVMRGGDPTACPGAELGPYVDEEKKVAGDDTRLLEDAKAELDKARAALK